jgi:hypothetical protein
VNHDRVHHRPRVKQTPWGLLLPLLYFLGTGAAWIGIAHLLLEYRRLLVPLDAFLFSGTRIGHILTYVAPAFPSLAIGILTASLLIGCIPPARGDMAKCFWLE